MKKFRVLSDLHLDINNKYPLSIKDKSIFTVLCGDIAGETSLAIDWVKKNCPYGVGISGNHLPYNDYGKTLQELREELATEFPNTSDFTYLDCETDVFSKVIDGILFIGTCMYSDMKISHPRWNPTGNKDINMNASMKHMNDYRYGIVKKECPEGKDREPTYIRITAKDYAMWFNNAFKKIDKLLNENEAKTEPFPVVLITHYNLITDFLTHNFYLDEAYSPRTYNWPSYASDYEWWLKKHTSIKCYCCGHIHAVEKMHRSFYIARDDNSKILVVNNARGYLHEGHDTDFNQNMFVDVDTWETFNEPVSKIEVEARKKRADAILNQLLSYGWEF